MDENSNPESLFQAGEQLVSWNLENLLGGLSRGYPLPRFFV